MRVTTISVNIRFSQDSGKGAWKTIELGTESTLSSSGEDWEASQRELYAKLSEQLRLVWNGKADPQHTEEGHRIDAQTSQSPAPPQQHWCAEHRVEFRRHEKDGNVWYSHRQGHAWCNEKG